MTITKGIDPKPPTAQKSSYAEHWLSWAIGVPLISGGLAYLFYWRPGIFLAVVSLLLIVVFHEMGHFFVARKSGMRPTEFSVGIGPPIMALQTRKTKFSFRVFPLGAFVRIPGMSKDEELEEGVKESETYRAAPVKSRILTVLAGPASHFVIIFFLIIVLYSVVGFAPISKIQNLENYELRIKEVTIDSRAQNAGIKAGDQLRVIKDDVGSDTQWTISKVGADGQVLSTHKVLVPKGELLGISFTQEPIAGLHNRVDPFTGLGYGIRDGISFIPEYARSLASIPGKLFAFTKASYSLQDVKDEDRVVSSIIGLTSLTADSLTKGSLQSFLIILMFINFAFAMINLLPIIPLDGGHIAVAMYEGIRSKRRRYFVDPKFIKYVGLVITILFFAFLILPALIQDIINPLNLF